MRALTKAEVNFVRFPMQVSSYEDLLTADITANLGRDLVIQLPYGSSGESTYFISSKADFDKFADKIAAEPEVKVMKRIRCQASAQEACVTKAGTIVGPPSGAVGPATKSRRSPSPRRSG